MASGSDTDIPVRVSHLETSVHQLHVDNQKTQTALAAISQEIGAQGKALSEIASKLEETRTRKPNLSAAVAAVGVIVTISILAFSPVYRELNEMLHFKEALMPEMAERAKVIVSSAARLDHVEDRQRGVEGRLLLVEANRFTKQDAQNMEAELRRDIDKLQEPQQ